MNGNSDLIWAGVRVFIALPLVLIMAFLVIKYGLSRRYAVNGGGRGRMELLEQLSLGPKTMLSLVSLGGKYYLLAHQDNDVRLIKELEQLPALEEAVTGDVMELIPRSVLEIDQSKENRLGQGQNFRWDAGSFTGAAQRGKVLITTVKAFLDKIRAQYGNKQNK